MLDRPVALAARDALGQERRAPAPWPARTSSGRRALVGAAVRVGDDGAVDLGQDVLGDQVAGDGAGAHRDVGQDLGGHGGVHAHVAEDHDVVGEDVVRVVVRQHEDARLAQERRAWPACLHHRAEVVVRVVWRRRRPPCRRGPSFTAQMPNIAGLAHQAAGLVQVHDPALGRGSAPGRRWANSSTRSGARGDVDEGALGQGELDAVGVEVRQRPARPRPAPPPRWPGTPAGRSGSGSRPPR